MATYKVGDKVITTSEATGMERVGTVVRIKRTNFGPLYVVEHKDGRSPFSTSYWSASNIMRFFTIKEIWKGLINA